MKSVIGIDQSLTSTGVCVVEGKKVQLSTTICPKATDEVDRLIEIETRLAEIIVENKVEVAVMEGYSFLGGGRLASLGEVGGIIKKMLRQLGIEFHIVAPMTLKKFCNSSKSKGKNKVMLEIYKRYGVEFEDDNQTDAFGLAMIGTEIQYYNKNKEFSKMLKKYELESVQKVLKI